MAVQWNTYLHSWLSHTVSVKASNKNLCPKCLLLRPGPPHRISDVRARCVGGKRLPALAVEAAEVRMRASMLVMMAGHKRSQGRRITSGYQCRVDGFRWGRVCLLLGERKRSLTCISAGFLCLLALRGYEVADPEQAGPHAVMVVVLAGTAGLVLGHDSILILLCPQEVDHALQNLCLLHLWILQFLNQENHSTD